MNEGKSIWESAAIPGLILGVIPAVYTLLGGYLGDWQPLGSGLVLLKTAASMALWASKFALCIVVFRLYMRKFSGGETPEDNKLFLFGVTMALLSAIIYSGAYLAYITYVRPDFLDSTLQVFQQEVFPKLDAATRNSFEEMVPKLPRMMFFANLIYCFCFGTVLSMIFTSKFKQ